MKNLQTFEEFLNEQQINKKNVNEGINYGEGVDADLYDVGVNVIYDNGGDPNELSDKEVENAAIKAMQKSKPVSLTGKFKNDLTSFLKYVETTFKKCGINFDIKNTVIDSSNFSNELMIPIVNSDFYFNTMLDYSELSSNGSNFVIGGSFASDEEGSVGDVIGDLTKIKDVEKVCKDFRSEYLNENFSELTQL